MEKRRPVLTQLPPKVEARHEPVAQDLAHEVTSGTRSSNRCEARGVEANQNEETNAVSQKVETQNLTVTSPSAKGKPIGATGWPLAIEDWGVIMVLAGGLLLTVCWLGLLLYAMYWLVDYGLS